MMNLHISLLLESEARSTSRISRKFLIKALAMFAGLGISLLIVVVLVGARSAEQAWLSAQREKKQQESAFRTVNELRQELASLQELTNAIAAWAQTRPDWPALLSGLQSVVPANIQLIRLTVNENITAIDGVPTRGVTLYLQGKAAGEHSETDVQELEKSLKEKSPFKEVTEFAQVTQFESAKIEGQKNLRVFDIECRFKALKLLPPAKASPPGAEQSKAPIPETEQ